MSTRSKLIGAGSVLAVIVVFYLLLSLSKQTSYSLLANKLDATESANITSTLSKNNIPYQTSDAGQTIDVAASKIDQARALIAQNNLLNGGQVGWEIFDKTSLGSTDFQQQINYQRALEGEVARAIDQISGIQSATVNLAMPQEKLFTSQQQPTTASVVLTLSSGSLDSNQVQGIAQLVASAVPGLSEKDVTITDQNGSLLNGGPQSNSLFGDGSGSGSKLSAQTTYQNNMEAQLEALLSRVAGGPDKLSVQVTADLNWDKIHKDSEIWAKKGTPQTVTTDNENFNGTGQVPSGVAGTSTNTPATYAQGGSTSGNSKYTHKQTSTTYAISKTLTSQDVAPGEVKRLSVSVLVDTSVPASNLAAIRSAVAAAIGYDPTRKDVVNVSRMAFQTPSGTTATTSGGLSSMLGLVKTVVAGLAALLLLIYFVITFRRRERKMMTISSAALPSNRPPAVITTEDEPAGDHNRLSPAMSREAAARIELQEQAEDVARERPKESANMIGNWLNE